MGEQSAAECGEKFLLSNFRNKKAAPQSLSLRGASPFFVGRKSAPSSIRCAPERMRGKQRKDVCAAPPQKFVQGASMYDVLTEGGRGSEKYSTIAV